MKTKTKTAEEDKESMADFKQRIAILMRGRKGGEIYSVIGASRPDESSTRIATTADASAATAERSRIATTAFSG